MEYKILITGTMGAGKTTAIEHISDEPPVLTDVTNTRPSESAKATTTAAFDYGELDIGEGDVLRIYGTPGQERFSFMWPVLARGAIGIIYLVDQSQPAPLSDLARFLDGFGRMSMEIPSVIALNKTPSGEEAGVESVQDYLEERGLPWPAVAVDAREREDMIGVLDMILSLNEAQALEET